MRDARISENRQKLLDEYANKPFEIGDLAYFIGGFNNKERLYKITKLKPLRGTETSAGYNIEPNRYIVDLMLDGLYPLGDDFGEQFEKWRT